MMNNQEYQTDNDFESSGLSRLTAVNWQNEHHRRSITASLVQGVYALEYARHKKREVCKEWWEFFDFHLSEPLTDGGIFGAVFEFKSKMGNYHPVGAPTYVIAFRGTLMKKRTLIRDMKLNIKVLKSKLYSDEPPIEKAIQAVKDKVSINGATIWLAGHSLGSSVAMLAGINMSKTGQYLKSYLFNPPFVAYPGKRGILVTGAFVIKAALTGFRRDYQETRHLQNLFSDSQICKWLPNLYLHPLDPICSGYITYFELLEKMNNDGVDFISSLKEPLMEDLGKKYRLEELNLVPSACVTASSSPILQAHNLSQWFTDDTVQDPPKVYCFN